ncbi:MAG: CDP-glycerol glycerophosphotransferase family protein, partial [Arcanobacterium sp.]|nr:CDP-glycerol glycerophosphotransferase family protein [Arcanobacterium sp.]
GFLSDGSWPPLPFTIAHYASANAPADADLSAAQPERTAHVAQAIAQTARVERTTPAERTTPTARETELATKESAAEQPPSFTATPIAAAHASTGTSTPAMLSTSGPSKRTIRWVRRLATGRTAAADLIAVSTRKLRELPLRAHRKMLTVSATALRLPALRTLKTRRYQGAWIISDRPQGAGDNGEHFYRFLRAEYPEIPAFFLLDPASPDRRKLAREGFRFLPNNPLGLAAAYSQAAVFISSDWASQDIARLHRLTPPPQRVPFVFLQHGITKDDISAWLNHLPIALITTALPEEQEYLTADDSPYHLKHGKAQLTGFARFDRLHELSRKQAREPLAMQHTAMHPDFSDFNSASHTTHNDTAYAEERGAEAHCCTPSTTRHGVSHIERNDRTLPAAHTAKCPHIAQFGGKQQLTAAHTAEHLAAHNPAHILIMPTWRRSLNDQLRTATTAEQRRQLLTDSPFLRAWAELLHTPQLAELMNSGEADVTIVLHPNLAPIAADIVAATRGTATVLDIRTVDFQEWLTRADIFLTDYSSTAFDAVVAGCEVAYFQFDRTEFFAGAHSMLPGWFDYDRDGFGPCFEDSASAASWLSQRAHARTGANTSDTPEPYASRIRALCTALPHHACANIYAAVHRLLAQRENSEGAA